MKMEWYESFVSYLEDEDFCTMLIENKGHYFSFSSFEYSTNLVTDEGVFYSYRPLIVF